MAKKSPAKNNAHILQQFNNRPALVAPQHVQSLQLFGSSPPRAQGEEDLAAYEQFCAACIGLVVSDTSKPFMFSGGIALIPVYGILLHRYSHVSEWATGYDYIRTRLAMAMGDPEVKGIVLDINSYGGMVAGNFELCDLIYAARAQKPVTALVDGCAFSGGYSIASAASKIVVTPSSQVGSVGVVMMHTSYEGMLTEMGIKTTFVYAGKHKVDGNAYQDLPEDVRKRLQSEVNKSYEKFVSLVSRNRSMSTDAVRATEALCYDAEDALTLGLIDAICSPSEALVTFRQELESIDDETDDSFDTDLNMGATHMSTNTPAAGGDNPTVAPTAAAPVAAAPVTQTVAAVTPDAPDARQAERQRMQAITSSEHAKGREELANHLAYETELSAESAIAMMAKAPLPTPPASSASASPFAAAMDATQNPNVGSGDGGGGDGEDPNADSIGVQIAKSYSRITGVKLVEQHH